MSEWTKEREAEIRNKCRYTSSVVVALHAIDDLLAELDRREALLAPYTHETIVAALERARRIEEAAKDYLEDMQEWDEPHCSDENCKICNFRKALRHD